MLAQSLQTMFAPNDGCWLPGSSERKSKVRNRVAQQGSIEVKLRGLCVPAKWQLVLRRTKWLHYDKSRFTVKAASASRRPRKTLWRLWRRWVTGS
jgi:hypothetical protein